jgi:hypothetical protein
MKRTWTEKLLLALTLVACSALQFRDAYPVTVLLPTPLEAGQSVTLTASLTSTHASVAKPAEISQTEEQFLLWRGDAGVKSRYETDVARIKIRCVCRPPSGRF